MRRVLLALVLLAALVVALPSPARALTPLHVLAVGDSLTVDAGWRTEFSTLAAAAGVDAQFDVYAVRGWGTADALPGLAAVLVATKPDLVVIAIGTNDAAAGASDVPGFEARYQRILGTVLDASSALVAPAWMAYSVPPSTLAGGEAARNDAVFRCEAARGWIGGSDPRLAGLVDLQPISPSFFVADGIHLTGAGYQVMGRQIYRGVRVAYGWPAIADESPALTGHRP